MEMPRFSVELLKEIAIGPGNRLLRHDRTGIWNAYLRGVGKQSKWFNHDENYDPDQ